MWKKVLSCVLSLVLCCLVLAACAPEETALTLPVDSIPSSCDPVLSDTVALSTVAANCYEGLVRIDENGNVQPGAADHWSISDDGLTYTFILRGGLRWHVPDADSKEAASKNPLGEDFILGFDTAMTADDFVFGLQRAVAKDTNAPGASRLFGIVNAPAVNAGELSSAELGVQALDDSTVRIKLSAPDGNFLTALGSPCAMPCNRTFFSKTAGRYGLTASLLLCNGPYYLSSMDSSGSSVTMKKNESYQGLTPGSVDSCTLVLGVENVEDGSSAKDILADLTSDEGTLDGAVLSAGAAETLPRIFEVTDYSTIVNTVLFNLESDFSGNEDLRLALASATDVSALVAEGAKGAEGIVPEVCNAVSGTMYRLSAGKAKGTSFNLKKAKKYYAAATEKFEAAATQDEPAPTSFTIKFLCLSEDKNTAKSLVQNWQKVFGTNLSVTVDTRDTEAELQRALIAGQYDVAYAPLRCTELTAIGVLRQFSGETDANLCRLASDEYDELLRRADSARDAETVTGYCLAAEEYLTTNGILL
ncbi:MAG: hypothetical protein IJ230_06535, partial [Clostridia bacterium]|nr:hypothetical protein [Clostridia bacterium]